MTLSKASFEYVRMSLRLRSAHVLDEDKSYLVETKLLPVARRHGFASVEDMVLQLRARSNERLMSELVEAMTINETFFFRDSHPFETLVQVVLPELVRLRASSRSLTIWSAASSSGQEPYSIAILLKHHFSELDGWNVRLIASDLSNTMLDRARAGCYTEMEVSRGLPSEFRTTYFHKKDDGWQLREDIRRMVEFRTINLNTVWPELPMCDLILLRNVLIYFDGPTRQQVLERVKRVLHPDGYLILGGAETTHNIDDGFMPVSFGKVSFFRPRS
jgi:chemotaxis protein methyltransferase CheR